MGKRPARCYRIPKNRAYTRKEYIKAIPASKITIFDMGNLRDADSFEVELSLVAKEMANITHNALEAARVAANRYLMKKAGRSNFYLKIRVYPHEILRENKMATGAGADRVSDGMRRAFGKPIGLAARVRKGQRIMSVRVNPNNYTIAKTALKRASSKLPVPCSVVIDRGKEKLKL